ncbi:MAG: histidine kinase [Cyclobacteriaceae bacterium]|nr:histidine kinase [Cyclobacteriaceae bacterium]
MTITRQILLRELRDVGLLALAGFSMTWIFGYVKSPAQYFYVGSFTALMWILLWKGNSNLSGLFENYLSWFRSPLKTFILLFLATVTYTISSVYLLIKLYEWAFDINFGDILPMLYSAVTVTIIITLFMHGRSFLMEWKQSAIDAEKLKHESVTARYESLKNQVNPHFLFNSLNALTNLVYENQDLAAKFIKQLSEVYRYVLDTRDRELVSDEEEIKFLESYTFLQKIRFGDNLNIDVKLEDPRTSFPPLVLQMLIENAIKHNEISTDHPLTINIFNEDGYTVVQNNLRKKRIMKEDSPGIGLANISSRYEFLSEKKVEIEELDGKFIVRLPVLPVSKVGHL